MRLRCLTLGGLLALLIGAAPVWSREAASSATCQAAANRAPIAGARSAALQNPTDLQAAFRLADAWSDAGCFADALQTLQRGSEEHPENKELVTRLRVARSLIGEEHYFDDLARVEAGARLKRATFRCNSLGDQEACSEIQHPRADDPAPRQKASEIPAPATEVATRVAGAGPGPGPGPGVSDAKAAVTTRSPRPAREPLTAARYSNEAPASRTH